MSGITVAAYEVENLVEVALREQRAERQRLAAVSAQLAALRAEAEVYRSVYGDRVGTVPAPPAVRGSADAGRVAAARAQVEGLVAQHRDALRRQVAAAARQDFGRLLATPPPPPPAATGPGRRRDRAAPAGREAPIQPAGRETPIQPDTDRDAEARRRERARREALADRAAKLLARVPAGVPEATRENYRRAAEEIVSTPSESRARLLLDDLAHRVAGEAERAERAERVMTELSGLAAHLETVGGEEAGRLRRRVEALLAQPPPEVPADLPTEVHAAVERADLARHRKTTAATLRLSLTDLGYDVSEGFETVLVADGAAFARLPGAAGYGVKVLLDEDRAAVRTQVVRGRATAADASADESAEQAFCDDYPKLLDRLRRHGVATRLLGLRDPGEVGVPEVEDRLIPAATTRTDVRRTKERGA